MRTNLLSATCLLLLIAGCGSLNPTRDEKPTDVDALTADLYQQWERAETTPPDPKKTDCRLYESPRQSKLRILEEAERLAMEHPRHVPTLMLCAGLSYELLKAAADRPWLRHASKPGIWLQRLTTGEPDDDMVEVAVASLLASLDDEERTEVLARGPVIPGALDVETSD